MSDKTLLFISANHFHAYTWKKGVLSESLRFNDNPGGREQFAAFLHSHKNPTYLLTDFIEEDFRYEIVPHLRGGERSALLQRKFEQYYRNTPFRQALVLHRQEDGRRDDEILFTALTNPALILPWELKAGATAPQVSIRVSEGDKSGVVASVEAGVIANLHDCNGRWCRVTIDAYTGYIEQKKLWGVYEGETIK